MIFKGLKKVNNTSNESFTMDKIITELFHSTLQVNVIKINIRNVNIKW